MFDFKNNTNKPHNYIIIVLVLFVIFVSGFYVGKNQVVCRVCAPEDVDFSLFWDAYNELSHNFINPEDIDDKEVVYGAISGMAKSLGDPYTDFFNPEQAKIFSQDLSGSFEGIGVEIGIKQNRLTVIAPLPGTPGDRAGLKSGDIILEINGESADDMPIEEAVSLIRGRKGTKVNLTVYREEWNEPMKIEITRDTIKFDSVRWELKEDNIAYIKILHFSQSLPADFSKISLEILKTPAKKIVLDLRGNPGGYLEVSQDIAGWFLKSGQIVTIEDFGKDRESKEYRANGNSVFSDYPTVVLINQGTASASEILAGALRDNRNVQLIGEKSFGKGSVQEILTLGDGKSILKVTIAKWLTPKGNLIAEVGLDPDIKVEPTQEDIDRENDVQLERALEITKGLE